MKVHIHFAAIAAAILSTVIIGCSSKQTVNASPYVTVNNGEFYVGDSIYRYVGTNFWYGAILASTGRGGDRQRLAKELDQLQECGIDNLRILAGGDGQENIPSHIMPVLQTAPRCL
jgi:mannan endo-1,4-beta-mannosidase